MSRTQKRHAKTFQIPDLSNMLRTGRRRSVAYTIDRTTPDGTRTLLRKGMLVALPSVLWDIARLTIEAWIS